MTSSASEPLSGSTIGEVALILGVLALAAFYAFRDPPVSKSKRSRPHLRVVQ